MIYGKSQRMRLENVCTPLEYTLPLLFLLTDAYLTLFWCINLLSIDSCAANYWPWTLIFSTLYFVFVLIPWYPSLNTIHQYW